MVKVKYTSTLQWNRYLSGPQSFAGDFHVLRGQTLPIHHASKMRRKWFHFRTLLFVFIKILFRDNSIIVSQEPWAMNLRE